MNEEEAIEILKDIEIIDFYNNYSEYTFPEKEVKEKFKAIETVLNLLEKKDINIIEAKEANRQLSIELQKKDKIIDEMAKSLIGVIFSDENNVEIIFENKEELKQYFENQAKM